MALRNARMSFSPTIRRARASDGPRTDANGYRCTLHYTPQPDDTCTSVTRAFGLTQAMFVNMNPEVGENCELLETGAQYCVQTVISGNVGRPLVMNGMQ